MNNLKYFICNKYCGQESELCVSLPDNCWKKIPMGELCKIIDEADVRPVVHAQWIEDGDNQPTSHDKCYCCSNCHGNRRFEWQLKPFCEDCGADMREVEE